MQPDKTINRYDLLYKTSNRIYNQGNNKTQAKFNHFSTALSYKNNSDNDINKILHKYFDIKNSDRQKVNNLTLEEKSIQELSKNARRFNWFNRGHTIFTRGYLTLLASVVISKLGNKAFEVGKVEVDKIKKIIKENLQSYLHPNNNVPMSMYNQRKYDKACREIDDSDYLDNIHQDDKNIYFKDYNNIKVNNSNTELLNLLNKTDIPIKAKEEIMKCYKNKSLNLNLNSLGLKQIPSEEVFNYLSHVKRINLENNLITEIDFNCFKNLENLENINLSQNNINKLPLYKFLERLQFCNISYNNINLENRKEFRSLNKTTKIFNKNSNILKQNDIIDYFSTQNIQTIQNHQNKFCLEQVIEKSKTLKINPNIQMKVIISYIIKIFESTKEYDDNTKEEFNKKLEEIISKFFKANPKDEIEFELLLSVYTVKSYIQYHNKTFTNQINIENILNCKGLRYWDDNFKEIINNNEIELPYYEMFTKLRKRHLDEILTTDLRGYYIKNEDLF